MHSFSQELRYALRQLRQAPGFALISILTLALGIGANIAVFSVTNAVLLNPSGIPHPRGLVALRARYMALADLHNIGISAPDFGDAEDGHNIFSSAAVMQANSFNYSRENGNPELLNGATVSSGYFDTFGVKPMMGRGFTPEEDQPGAEHETVLSYRVWVKRFGSDPNIVGQTLMLNNQPYRVIGVMDRSFNWPNQAEIWVPIALPPARYKDPNYRYNEYLFSVARLRAGRDAATGERISQHEGRAEYRVGEQQHAQPRTAAFPRVLAGPADGACSPCRSPNSSAAICASRSPCC